MTRRTTPETGATPRAGTRVFAHLQWQALEQYIRAGRMWHRVYRLASYTRSALWIAPLIALALVLAVAGPIRWLDAWIDLPFAGLNAEGAQSLYETVVTLTLSFIVFTFGSLLVAIQVAGGQLTPRIIATTLLRDNVVRWSVGLFVFTLIFAVTALNRQGTRVLELVAFITGVLGIGCVATFLFLIDYAARLLRPVSIVSRVGNSGIDVIKSVYPNPVSDSPETDIDWRRAAGAAQRIIPHTGRSEIVLAVDVDTLVIAARRAGGLIEFLPQIGDFVAQDEPLFALYGGAADIADEKLFAAVAFGPERTIEQDPMFALRIVVDIALKALSPAINDPTTAVLALDQVHRLLRAAGQRQLHGEVICDQDGQPRVIHRTPDWEDFVDVGCTEIRYCGAKSVQVARRMRAMLDNLCLTLPAHRRIALDEERDKLDAMIATSYDIAADRELARLPDRQGLGGSSSARVTDVPSESLRRLA